MTALGGEIPDDALAIADGARRPLRVRYLQLGALMTTTYNLDYAAGDGTLRSAQPSILKGMVAGAVAGLVASFVMTRFHVALSGRGRTGSEEPQSEKPVDGRDDAAMKVADGVAHTMIGRPLTRYEKTEIGGPAAHYAFGAAAGAFYGAMREVSPSSPFAKGGPYGAAVWVVADQLGLPVSGLSPWPLKAYPATTNLQHFVSHVVYGWAAALTYRTVRRAL